jgi:hypothetical protein
MKLKSGPRSEWVMLCLSSSVSMEGQPFKQTLYWFMVMLLWFRKEDANFHRSFPFFLVIILTRDRFVVS